MHGSGSEERQLQAGTLEGPRQRVRPTLQIERSEDTRQRLCRAALESLVALGYSGTSTTEIADRAGVSRGALVHHYPSKAALMADAVTRLLVDRHNEIIQTLEETPAAAQRTVADCVDLVWSVADGWSFPAWLEVVVASRTDPELRAEVMRKTGLWVASVGKTLQDYVPESADNPVLRDTEFLFALVDGIALSRLLYFDLDGPPRMLEIVRRLVQVSHPQPATPVA